MLRVQTICRLGQDAIVNNTNGKTVINFNAAYSEKYKNHEGQEVVNTTWINCAYWTDKTGIAQYLKKGNQVFLEGKPEVRVYTNKEGMSVPQLAVRVSMVKLLASPQQSQGQGNQSQQSQQAAYPTEDMVDDLPF
jgi:single-strand DNA-binding protein